MKPYHWEQLLEEEDLVALTEEALDSGAARHIPWRRLGAAAACLALVLCLANYPALAAGVKRLADYFSGVGAVEQGTSVLVLEAPLTWTDGTWSYRLDAYQTGSQLFVRMEYLSTQPKPEADGEVPDYSCRMELLPPSGWEGAWLSRDQVSDRFLSYYEDLNSWSSPEGAALREAGYRTYGSHSSLFRTEGFAGNHYRLAITFTHTALPEEAGTLTYEKELHLIPEEAKPAISDSRTFPEGTVTVLVSEDGSGVTNFVEWSQSSGDSPALHSLELQFIGASGKHYPAGFHNTYLEDFEHVEYYPRYPVEEPIAAVEISGILFGDRSGQRQQHYEDLNWVISLT